MAQQCGSDILGQRQLLMARALAMHDTKRVGNIESPARVYYAVLPLTARAALVPLLFSNLCRRSLTLRAKLPLCQEVLHDLW
jgi:hypothetical protein